MSWVNRRRMNYDMFEFVIPPHRTLGVDQDPAARPRLTDACSRTHDPCRLAAKEWRLIERTMNMSSKFRPRPAIPGRVFLDT